MNESELTALVEKLNTDGLSAFDEENHPDTIITKYTEINETLKVERQQKQVKSEEILTPVGEEMEASLLVSEAESFQELVEAPTHEVDKADVATYLAICTDCSVTDIAHHI